MFDKMSLCYCDIVSGYFYFQSFTFIFNPLLEFKHIAVKSRENNDCENSGGVELQPFLDPNADPNSEGIYWSNAESISNMINTVF